MKMLQVIIDNGWRLWFIFSLCLGSLLYGVYAGRHELFPYSQLRDAKVAAKAIVEVFRAESDSGAADNAGGGEGTEEPGPDIARPTVINHVQTTDDSLILVAGGPGFLKKYHEDGGCLAWLMDRQGEVKHIWKFRSDLWPEMKTVKSLPLVGLSYAYPVDVHLLDDGGILVSFQARNTWPFAIGMARLDKDSNIIWKKEFNAHHWFTITPDKKIITPSLRMMDAPRAVGRTQSRIQGDNGKYFDDMITTLTMDGEILEQVSMLDVLEKSGLNSLFYGSVNDAPRDVNTDDPLHLNFIERVGEEIAAERPEFNADDLLVSFRQLNTLAIIDRPSWTIKWISSGSTHRQHCPRFLDSKHILIFDNQGGDMSLGGTRLARMSLDRRLAETVFPTSENPPASRVYSKSAGFIDIGRERKTALMSVTNQGRLLEIDLATALPRWEYQFVEEGVKRPNLFCARYIYNVSFPLNQVEAGK